MGYRVAVAGATGNVGREMLNILAERQFPVDEIAVLASRKSLGTECSFGDKTVKTKDLDTFDFTGWDIALFAIGSDATKTYGPKAAAAGCVVIDNSSLYRYDPDVVVLGGGMSQISRLYEAVPRIWQEWAFSDRVDTPLRPPVHGDSSGVRGAAWLWGEGEGSST